MKRKLCLFLAIGTFSYSAFSDIPKGFEGFHEYSNEKITLLLPNNKIDVFLDVRFDSARTEDEQELDKIRRFLLDYRIKKNQVDNIIESLRAGIVTSDKCVGSTDTCVIQTETYDFVLSYDSKTLRLILSSNALDRKALKKVFHSNENKSPAIINSINPVLEKTRYDDVKLRLDDKLLIGHKYGYTRSDFNVDTYADKLFNLNELSYNVDIQDKFLEIGYYENYYSDNATNVFDLSSNQEQLSVSLGSSNKLISKEGITGKSLEVFSPKRGRIKLLKGDRVIYSAYINSGRIYVPYNKLPKGTYDVTVLITDREEKRALVEENRTVYNTQSLPLLKDDKEYQLSAGIYTRSEEYISSDSEEYISSDNDEIFTIKSETNNIPFAKSMFAYGLSDSLALGLGGTITDIGVLAHLGAEYKSKNISFNNKYALSSKGSLNSSFSISSQHVGSFSYNYKNTKDKLSNFIFGEGYSERFSYNTPALDLRGIGLSFGLVKDSYKTQDFNDKQLYVTNSLNYTFSNGVSVSNNIDYDLHDNEFTTMFNLDIPLAKNINSSLSIGTSQYEEYESDLSLSTNDLLVNKEKELRLDLTNELTPDSRSELLAQYHEGNANYNLSADGLVNTDGQTEITLDFRNTQIISRDEIKFTSSESDSYFRLDIDSSSKNVADYGVINRRKEGKLLPTLNIYEQDTLFTVNSYEKQDFLYDASTANILQYGEDQISTFVLPGSYHKLNPRVEKLVSFVSTFEDIEKNDIDGLSCEGDGCVSIEEVVDGVYKVSVKEDEAFKLSSKELVCLTPGVKQINNLNIGLNTCIPDIDYEDKDAVKYVKNIHNEKIYFLGTFDDITYETKIAKVINNNSDFLVKKISNNNYVYVKTEDDIVLESGDNYALNYILNTDNIKYAINYIYNSSKNESQPETEYALTLGGMWNKKGK